MTRVAVSFFGNMLVSMTEWVDAAPFGEIERLQGRRIAKRTDVVATAAVSLRMSLRIARQARAHGELDSLIIRPLADWIGRAFIGYSRAKMPICSAEIGTGFFITIHSTPSLHGGVVSDPM